MSKSEELLRLENDIAAQPELKEKLEAEMRRLAEEKAVSSDGEAMAKAAEALGYAVTAEELERAAAEMESLDDDELEDMGGGKWDPLMPDSPTEKQRRKCDAPIYRAQRATYRPEVSKDEFGKDGACLVDYHCTMTFKHNDSKSKDVLCFKDYVCYAIVNQD